MAVTQFEAVDARRCFPFWDEPALKATFKITVDVPLELIALSNMPVISEKLNGHLKTVYFEESPIMSTYLVAVVVGLFDHIEETTADGTSQCFTPFLNWIWLLSLILRMRLWRIMVLSLIVNLSCFMMICILQLLTSRGIAECFAFLICTRWYNPAIHRHSHIIETGSSSNIIRYLDWNTGVVVSSDEDQQQSRICNLQYIGGHIMKIPVIGFQVLLFMHLEGTPSSARHIPYAILFAPLFLLQGAGVLFAVYRLVEKIILLLCSGAGMGRCSTISSKVRDWFAFLHHGSSLLGWWSIDEGSREE